MATHLKGTVKTFYTPFLLLCFVYDIPLRSLKILDSSHWHLAPYTVQIEVVFNGNVSEPGSFLLRVSACIVRCSAGPSSLWISSRGVPIIAPMQPGDGREHLKCRIRSPYKLMTVRLLNITSWKVIPNTCIQA